MAGNVLPTSNFDRITRGGSRQPEDGAEERGRLELITEEKEAARDKRDAWY